MQNKGIIFAHRGLHGKNAPENSLVSFENAIEAGLGIELDVRLSADGVPVVFHDKTLKRMCGDSRMVLSLTFSELQKMRLDGTEMTIPSFEQVLELVDGRCPLLIETKLPKRHIWHKKLERSMLPLLEKYKGVYYLQSFNRYSMKYMKSKLSGIKCGILSGAIYPEPSGFDFVNYKLAGLTKEKVLQLRKKYPCILAWGMAEYSIDECLKAMRELELDGIVCGK